jgi:tetratricopeptide (TPR) repeat protein
LAIEQFKNAYKLSRQVDDLYTIIRSLNNIALSYKNLNELDSAFYYASQAIETNLNAGSPYLLSFSNRIIGDVYFNRNQLDSAEKIYEKALENGELQGLTTLRASILHRLGNTYSTKWKTGTSKGCVI